VRVEKAFPAIITRAQLQRVGKHLSSRAPKFSHPRRVGSSYLLSGLAKCKTCNTPLIGRFAQSGKYSYYVCQSNIKLGRDACETPTLNARRFEELVVNKIRSNILTEGNIRDLVKGVAEEMDGVTREQRKRLETIDTELEDVKRRLGRIWNAIETSDIDIADASDRVKEHRERKERLEDAAADARAILSERRAHLDDVKTISAYAKDMRDFLNESELTERRAFIESFVKEIIVMPGDALMRYTVPMPDDSLIPGRATEKVALNGSVLSTVHDGGPGWTRTNDLGLIRTAL
jgi:site-specific DNA recombinase